MEKERENQRAQAKCLKHTPHSGTAKYDGNRSLPMDFVTSCRDDEEGSIRRAMYDKDILAGAGSAQSQLQCLRMIGELSSTITWRRDPQWLRWWRKLSK